MAVFDKLTSDIAFIWGEENTVASFYVWLNKLFNHPRGYPVLFDHDFKEFDVKKITKFPCITVQQIDTQDIVKQYIGGKANQTDLLFYIYFNHHLQFGGDRRQLRRGRDQISFALKNAGVTNSAGAFMIDPIYTYDFSQSPPILAGGALSVKGGVQQRFTQDVDILQYEMMVTLTYLEKF